MALLLSLFHCASVPKFFTINSATVCCTVPTHLTITVPLFPTSLDYYCDIAPLLNLTLLSLWLPATDSPPFISLWHCPTVPLFHHTLLSLWHCATVPPHITFFMVTLSNCSTTLYYHGVTHPSFHPRVSAVKVSLLDLFSWRLNKYLLATDAATGGATSNKSKTCLLCFSPLKS